MRRFEKIEHLFFDIGILLKGIDGVLELLGGFLILFLGKSGLTNIALFLFKNEIIEDPRDFIATHVISLASHASLGIITFSAIYLLIHGIIKIGLVAALWKDKIWAFPAGIIIFGLLGVYQIYTLFIQYSILMTFLTVLDFVVIWLIYVEYKRVIKIRARGVKNKS